MNNTNNKTNEDPSLRTTPHRTVAPTEPNRANPSEARKASGSATEPKDQFMTDRDGRTRKANLQAKVEDSMDDETDLGATGRRSSTSL